MYADCILEGYKDFGLDRACFEKAIRDVQEALGGEHNEGYGKEARNGRTLRTR